jgi:hypothetical protein
MSLGRLKAAMSTDVYDVRRRPTLWESWLLATLRLFELAFVLVRFDHVAGRIVNANHSKTTRSLLHDAVKL